jgi:hypothetical protein
MMPKLALAAVTAMMLCGSSASGIALPSAPIISLQRLSDIHKASFGGWPFPYGYAWSRARACTKYLPVETKDGRARWQRVWVCDEAKRSTPLD